MILLNNGGFFFEGDVFVSKLNSGLTSLLASTYLGGSDDDNGSSLAIDISGDVCVTGNTNSTDFPTTSGAYDTSYNGSNSDEDGGDAFISKLNSELTSLLASTFLGGSEYDFGKSLALDTSGNVYVTGFTDSTDFPTTSGAYDTSYNGGDKDVFISKLDRKLTSLPASTFLGGSEYDLGRSLALDTSGNVYVTGETDSTDFPTTSGAYDTSFNGGDGCSDIFVSKLNSGLTSLLVSTFLGGASQDYGFSLAIDTSGNIYVTGDTSSTDFLMTSGVYDTSFNGYFDVFISKLNSELTSLLASTYLGGSHWDVGYFLTLDTGGNVYVTGSTWSTNFPATSGAYDTSFDGSCDVFVSKLDGNLSADVCTYSISPTSKSFCASGGNGSIGVTVTSNSCTWTAVGNEAWITVTSGSSGTANGTVTYSVSANTGASERTGTITVAGETFTVIEDGNSCKYTISPIHKSFGSRGGNGRVRVKAKSGCCWTATSNTAWISVKSGDSGEGNGTVAFSVSANTGTSDRTGTMSIAGKVFTVTQSGIPCTYSISPVSASFNANSGGGTIGVRTSSESCTWTAVSNATWITITSGGSGTGSHVSVTYSVSANTGTSDRTGTISVAGKIFTVKQSRGK